MNYFFIIIAVLFIFYVLNMIRKKEFSAQESVFWMFGAVVTLVFAIAPKLLDALALKIGIDYPPSLLFLLGFFFLLIINFRNTKKIVKQNEKILELAQQCSILKFQMKQMEKKQENAEEEHTANV